MPLSRADVLLKQFDRMLADRTTVDATAREIAQYILPRKNISGLSSASVNRQPFLGGSAQEGAKRTEKLFDSTAINANELLAASMHGALVSPALKWFSLRMRNEKMNEIEAVTEWLEECRDRMLAAFRQSNLNSEIHEVFLDLGAFGTGAMVIEERTPMPGRFAGLRFQAIPVGDYCIAEDEEGRVNTLFRLVRLSASAAALKFDAGNLSEKTQQFLEREPTKMVEFLHAIYSRVATRKTGAQSFPIASCYIERDAKKLVGESGFHEFPVMVPRWTKISGEIYGRGPGHTALPDVKSLNKAKEFGLKAWAKKLDPPSIELDDGVIGSVRLTPAGRNVVRQMDALKFLEFKSDLQVDQIKSEDLRNSIRFIFFWDQLQPLGAARSSGNPSTATEVLKRIELVHQVLGPTMGRLESELLAPMVERTFALMLRARAFDPPPPILQQIVSQPGGEIDIVYEGPLARSQRASDINAIEGMLTDLLPLEQLAPGIVTDNYDLDALSRYVGMARGVPASLINSPEAVQAKKDARAQAQQAAQQQQQVLAAAEVMHKTAPLAKVAATNPAVLTGPLPGQPLREVQKGQPIPGP